MDRRMQKHIGCNGFAAMVVIAAGAQVAHAQPVSGPYVSLGGGGNLLQDEHLRLDENFPAGKFRYDTGGAAGVGAVGYGFGNGFRVEVEGDFRDNGLHQYLGTSFPTSASGHQQNYGGMMNALFDMDVRSPYLYPYFGGGIGYMRTRWENIQDNGTSTAYAFEARGTHGDLAYQGIFGLAFPVAFVPGLSITAEYRFMSLLGNGSFGGRSIGTEGPYGPKPLSEARGNVDITSDNNHSALLGIRYEFFPPAPPPPPSFAAPPPQAAPAPEPSRTYLVFFDWDRADLTARARQIVAEAAQASTHVQTTRIEVNGYTDLSGTAAYNQKLSVRRADSVAAELIRDGVQKNEISIHGYGEGSPLVPTAQGVREPQNRRVEIVLK
jgi:outer membrane protein OmpA-like peptidoglycan-associated protein